MNKKNLDIVYGIVVLFILGIVIYLSLRNDMGEILRLIKNLSLPFLLLSILLFVLGINGSLWYVIVLSNFLSKFSKKLQLLLSKNSFLL